MTQNRESSRKWNPKDRETGVGRCGGTNENMKKQEKYLEGEAAEGVLMLPVISESENPLTTLTASCLWTRGGADGRQRGASQLTFREA